MFFLFVIKTKKAYPFDKCDVCFDARHVDGHTHTTSSYRDSEERRPLRQITLYGSKESPACGELAPVS